MHYLNTLLANLLAILEGVVHLYPTLPLRI